MTTNKDKCQKGQACGRTCISKNKTCKDKLSKNVAKKLNATFGRFNILHAGHEELIKSLGKDAVVGVSGGKKNINPEMRVKAIEDQKYGAKVKVSPNLYKFVSELFSENPDKEITLHLGQDRADSGISLQKYFPNLEVVIGSRNAGKYSSTALRNLYDQVSGDGNKFKEIGLETGVLKNKNMADNALKSILEERNATK